MTGTFYNEKTPLKVCDILEESRISLHRIKIHYGDVKTGKVWGDIETCHVGRSTGTHKIPLAIKNSRSMGGGAILDHCIVKIEHANKKDGGVIYNITK
jgi:hypothetical protein